MTTIRFTAVRRTASRSGICPTATSVAIAAHEAEVVALIDRAAAIRGEQ